MNNFETSKGAIERASRWYQGAIRAYEDERWDDVIYSYQMSVEQALKAILILYGIEYPRKHDISKVYINLEKKDIPKWFIDKIDFQMDVLKDLISLRGVSAHGYVDGITKDYFINDASQFKEPVKKVIEECIKLIDEFLKKQESINSKE